MDRFPPYQRQNQRTIPIYKTSMMETGPPPPSAARPIPGVNDWPEIPPYGYYEIRNGVIHRASEVPYFQNSQFQQQNTEPPRRFDTPPYLRPSTVHNPQSASDSTPFPGAARFHEPPIHFEDYLAFGPRPLVHPPPQDDPQTRRPPPDGLQTGPARPGGIQIRLPYPRELQVVPPNPRFPNPDPRSLQPRYRGSFYQPHYRSAPSPAPPENQQIPPENRQILPENRQIRPLNAGVPRHAPPPNILPSPHFKPIFSLRRSEKCLSTAQLTAFGMYKWGICVVVCWCSFTLNGAFDMVFSVSSESGIHAEVRALHVVSKRERELGMKVRKIVLISSYSPCDRCATHVVDFVKARGCSFDLWFTKLYKHTEPENLKGLQELACYVKMSISNHEVWSYLFECTTLTINPNDLLLYPEECHVWDIIWPSQLTAILQRREDKIKHLDELFCKRDAMLENPGSSEFTLMSYQNIFNKIFASFN